MSARTKYINDNKHCFIMNNFGGYIDVQLLSLEPSAVSLDSFPTFSSDLSAVWVCVSSLAMAKKTVRLTRHTYFSANGSRAIFGALYTVEELPENEAIYGQRG